MPETREILINPSRLVSKEALNYLLAIIMMFVISGIGNIVEAGDDDIDTNDSISLVVDADAYGNFDLDGAINEANSLAGTSDIEQTGGTGDPEVLQTATLTINIRNGMNVRDIRGSGADFAIADNSFPRGEIVPLGWTNGDASPLGAKAPGIWLLLTDGTSTEPTHAISISINGLQSDGTSVTDEEATTAGGPEYSFDGSDFVSTAPAVATTEAPVLEAAPEPEADGDGDDGDETPVAPEVSETPPPELSFPEVTPTATVEHYTVSGEVANGVVPTMTSTVEINQDLLLPYEFGHTPSGISELTDILNYDVEPNPRMGEWPRTGLSGEIVNIIERSNGGNEFNYVELLTQTPGGNEFVAIIRLPRFVSFMPTTDQATLAISQGDSEVLWNANDVADEGLIIAPTRELRPGDHIILDVAVVEIEDNGPTGATRRQNMTHNNIDEGSIYGVFEAIDNGEINGVPFVSLFGGYHIMYNQD